MSAHFRFDELEQKLTAAPRGRARLFEDASFTAELTRRMGTLLEGRSLLSLDVFDTLVLRDNSSEITRFFEVAGRMAELASASTGRAVIQADAFVARYLGTHATYRASTPVEGCREGSLTELHRCASRLLTGEDELTDAFVEAELANETRRLTLNPFLRDYAARHREEGGKVVLITDMYMHADQVATLLANLGVSAADYDLLISSADTKVSKASGGIFELVEAQMAAGPGDFLHLGDSLRGDFMRPLQRGWQALHLPLSDFDLTQRRRDHLATVAWLAAEHSLSLDIAMPG